MTPALAASSRPHSPAASTTFSHSTSPRSVRTPTTRPRSRTKSVTSVSSKIRTPRCRAPLASDIVTSTGLARPSSGVQKPWMTSSVRISGTRSPTSRGRQHLLGHPHRAHVRRLAAEALVGARRRGQLEVAAAAEPRGQPRLLLQPRVQLGGVASHPQRILGRAARDDLTRRVPGGARGELLALQEYDVGRTRGARGGRRSTYRSRRHRPRRTAPGRAGRRRGRAKRPRPGRLRG